MNRISSEDAFSLLSKWKEERAILERSSTDGQPRHVRTRWVLVNSVVSDRKPSAIFSILGEPFPTAGISLEGVQFEYGDVRGFEDASQKDAEEMRAKWVCFLVLKLPIGRLLLLSELRREVEICSLVSEC